MANKSDQPIVLVTGGSGYVGARLIPQLEREPLTLRCLTRNADRLRPLVRPTTAVVQADVLDASSLEPALAQVHTAFYLIHQMASTRDFAEADRIAASNFAAACAAAGVARVIYLGGLGDDRDPRLSPHLRSRHEVGAILREHAGQTIELRASAIIGAGSLSYELVRALTERLPVMICPRWLMTATQPIAIRDVLAYLVAAIHLPATHSRIFEIGGADVVSYGDMIREYARARGLKRRLIQVPLLTPRLSGLWLALITPTRYAVGHHLIEGLKNPTVVRDPSALKEFAIRPVGIRTALQLAISESNDADTREPARRARHA